MHSVNQFGGYLGKNVHYSREIWKKVECYIYEINLGKYAFSHTKNVILFVITVYVFAITVIVITEL